MFKCGEDRVGIIVNLFWKTRDYISRPVDLFKDKMIDGRFSK